MCKREVSEGGERRTRNARRAAPVRQSQQQRRQQGEGQSARCEDSESNQIAQVTKRRNRAEVEGQESEDSRQRSESHRHGVLFETSRKSGSMIRSFFSAIGSEYDVHPLGNRDGGNDDRRDCRRRSEPHPQPARRTERRHERTEHDSGERKRAVRSAEEPGKTDDHEAEHHRQEHHAVRERTLAERMVHGDDSTDVDARSRVRALELRSEGPRRLDDRLIGRHGISVRAHSDHNRRPFTGRIDQPSRKLRRSEGNRAHRGAICSVERTGHIHQGSDRDQITGLWIVRRAVHGAVRVVGERLDPLREGQVPGARGERLEQFERGRREYVPLRRLDDEADGVRWTEHLSQMLEGQQLRIVRGKEGRVAGIEGQAHAAGGDHEHARKRKGDRRAAVAQRERPNPVAGRHAQSLSPQHLRQMRQASLSLALCSTVSAD